MTKAVSWLDRALSTMSENLYDDHRKVTGEQVRYWLKAKRLRAPHTPNMYGILINRAINLGLLKKTEKFVASETPSSHNAKIRVYTVSKRKLKNV